MFTYDCTCSCYRCCFDIKLPPLQLTHAEKNNLHYYKTVK